MVDERIVTLVELFARLLGVGLVVVGWFLVDWSLVVGVAFVGVGTLFALRPSLAADLFGFLSI